MGQVKEYIKIAIMNIRHNRGRSVLTMLGIIIGISSVIMVISIGNGVSASVDNELNGIAGGQLAFYVDTTRKDTTVTLNQSDIDYLEANLEHIDGASMLVSAWGTAETPKITIDAQLSGGNPSFYYDSKEPMIHGRYYNQNEYDSGSNVCVITESEAKTLFGTDDVVGMSIDITAWGISQDLKIIGVRKDSASGLISMLNGESTYVAPQVPATFLANKFGYYIDDIEIIYVYCEANEYCKDVAKKVMQILENRHHCQGENQILMESFSDISNQFDSIMGIVTLFVSFVAAISLLVGGIGVMNIMLVSVTERTREIGIRKSLGARTKSIMWQFLAEAGIITLIGGAVGIVLGLLGALGIGTVVGINSSIDALTVILASAFSCGIGIFFGIYPAKKAAKLSPIEALRHE